MTLVSVCVHFLKLLDTQTQKWTQSLTIDFLAKHLHMPCAWINLVLKLFKNILVENQVEETSMKLLLITRVCYVWFFISLFTYFFSIIKTFFQKVFNYGDVLILLKSVSNMILVKVICNVNVENHFLTLKSI